MNSYSINVVRLMLKGNSFSLDSVTRDYYSDGGAIQIWEMESGRCVRSYSNISGGVGINSTAYAYWNKDNLLGVSVSTNLISVYDPFSETDKEITNVSTFGEWGYDSAPMWKWVNDGTSIWAGNKVFMQVVPPGPEVCLPDEASDGVALVPIGDSKTAWIDGKTGEFVPEDEVEEIDSSFDSEVVLKIGKRKTAASDKANSSSLFDLTARMQTKDLSKLTAKEWMKLPLEVQQQLLQKTIDLHLKPSVLVTVQQTSDNDNAQIIRVWNVEKSGRIAAFKVPADFELSTKTVLCNKSRVVVHFVAKSETTKKKSWADPEPQVEHLVQIWQLDENSQPQLTEWATCGATLLQTIDFRAANGVIGMTDSSFFFAEQEDSPPQTKALTFWNIDSGKVLVQYQYPPPADMPPKQDHPWCLYKNSPANLKPFSNFDPVMWFWDFAEKSWRYIVLFDTGLIVLPNGDMQSAIEILKSKVSYVFENRFAWPLHWTLGTAITELVFDWKQALNKVDGLPELAMVSNETEVLALEQKAFEKVTWDKIPEGCMKPNLSSNYYEAIDEQKILQKDFLANPLLLEPLVTKCCRMMYCKADNDFSFMATGEHDITPTQIKDGKLGICQFKTSSMSSTSIRVDSVEWIAPVRFKPPKIEAVWKYVPTNQNNNQQSRKRIKN